jgi:uncharacterized protein
VFLTFFEELRRQQVPVTPREYLDLLAAMEAGIAEFDIESFYHLARCVLVKDERHFDRFDRVFGHCFRGLEKPAGPEERVLPAEWLRKLAEKLLSEEELARLKARDFDELMRELEDRLREQDSRHQGGSKWIGTGGTSPFGAHGANPAGVRIGQSAGRSGRAVKVWDERKFRDYDDGRELGTRNFKMALRRLRRFVREGVADEFDLDATIKATAQKAGWLDVKYRPERKNRVRVLMLLDVGGSMDRHVELTEQLFSAARAELGDLRSYYFHNCIYERLWSENPRRSEVETDTEEIFRRFDERWSVIVVGDAAMSPYEIIEPGGSVEHWNEESGESWLRRLFARYPRLVWLNPTPRKDWVYTTSTKMVQELTGDRMHDLTLGGIQTALKSLASGR